MTYIALVGLIILVIFLAFSKTVKTNVCQHQLLNRYGVTRYSDFGDVPMVTEFWQECSLCDHVSDSYAKNRASLYTSKTICWPDAENSTTDSAYVDVWVALYVDGEQASDGQRCQLLMTVEPDKMLVGVTEPVTLVSLKDGPRVVVVYDASPLHTSFETQVAGLITMAGKHTVWPHSEISEAKVATIH